MGKVKKTWVLERFIQRRTEGGMGRVLGTWRGFPAWAGEQQRKVVLRIT